MSLDRELGVPLQAFNASLRRKWVIINILGEFVSNIKNKNPPVRCGTLHIMYPLFICTHFSSFLKYPLFHLLL